MIKGEVTITGASEVHDCISDTTSAANKGGAVYVWGTGSMSGKLTITGGSSLYDNYAASDGGAVYAWRGEVAISGGARLHDNTAAGE